MEFTIELAPAQQSAYDAMQRSLRAGQFFLLRSEAGMGRTTILRKLHSVLGGAFFGTREFVESLMERTPLALEEAFFSRIKECFEAHDLVIVDDLHLLIRVTGGYKYPRQYLMDVVLTALAEHVCAGGKKLVLALDKETRFPAESRFQHSSVGDFTASDYAKLCPAQFAGLDYSRIHRFAPRLNGWQLKSVCASFAEAAPPDAEGFIEALRAHNITSNVEIDEVQPVSWKDLKGIDDVVEALETKIALPLENHELATSLRLKPRRGVLLAGPPGTGKTTIGRALAHRLKGKFFLIDGTVVAGSCDFYDEVNKVFEAAKRNAPSVIFIDDADVIFEGNKDQGFYRYLLTMLDGLESASAERVCVMMTAMDVGSLPPALVRSGRMELWLETRLPDEGARGAIIREVLGKLPEPFGGAEYAAIAAASHGLTGADLKSILEDGKLLYARDLAEQRPLLTPEEYCADAIRTVRENRRGYGRKKVAAFGEAARMGFTLG